MSAKVTIEGMDKLNLKIDKMSVDVSKVMDKAVSSVALKVEGDAKRLISSGERTGNQYKRGRKTHTASAPYEAPKTDTGNLVSNITTKFIDSKNAEVGVFSEKGAIYGAYLEFGTKSEDGETLMLPRPWLSRSYNQNREFTKKEFQRQLLKAIREAARG